MTAPRRPSTVPPPHRLLRAPAACLVVVLVAGCGAVPSGASDRDARAGSPVPSPVVPDRASAGESRAAVRDAPAAAVLRAWDAARSRAFSTGDMAALRELYVPGSAAGTSDVRLLRAYRRRGLRVEGMRTQVLALEVLGAHGRRLRLRVTDRLAGAVAVGRDGRRALPRDRATTRVVELRRDAAGEWRVASVRESARRPAGR